MQKNKPATQEIDWLDLHFSTFCIKILQLFFAFGESDLHTYIYSREIKYLGLY